MLALRPTAFYIPIGWGQRLPGTRSISPSSDANALIVRPGRALKWNDVPPSIVPCGCSGSEGIPVALNREKIRQSRTWAAD